MMNIFETESGLICPRNELNIERTLECGQVFRYFPQKDGSYRVISGDKSSRLYYDGDSTVIETADKEYFYRYFDLDTDYNRIISELGNFEELRDCLSVAQGLRILRQQNFETVVSFIISANNNIKRIQGIVERLCALCGEKKDGYAAFPTREQMLSLRPEDYRRIGCGFRSEYLFETVPKLADEYLRAIGAMNSQGAQKELCALKGIGPKVAQCIMLFAYKMTDSYPVDTWIFKAGKTDELNTPKLVQEYYSNRYGSFAGYAQQYVFQFNRNEA